MERNFTEERKNEVRNVIESNLKIWNALSLQMYSTSKFIAELGLFSVTDFADTYRDKIVHNLKKDLEILDEKYIVVKDIEQSYVANQIAGAKEAIRNLNVYILKLAETICGDNEGIDESKKNSLNTTWNNYELVFEKVQRKREYVYDVENIIYGVDGLRRNPEWVAIKQKEYVVEAYELIHPEIKKKMEMFLGTGEPNKLTKDDMTSIKYIAYTAPEPYRTVYLECVGIYEIGYISEQKLSSKEANAWFNPSENKIYMENIETYLSKNKRGDYTTFFHESGHAIDYNLCIDENNFFTVEYSTNKSCFQEIMDTTNTDKATLHKAIYCDVYNDIEKKISKEVMKLTEEQKECVDVQKICGSFIYGSEKIKLTKEERAVRLKVIDEYDNNLSCEKYEAISDLYGGITNFVLYSSEGYGHRGTNDTGKYIYWYENDGASTMATSKEFFAIYFSQQMVGDLQAIKATKEYFPNASELMEQIVLTMKESIKSR